MRYFIIAGEVSGDQHAAGLMSELIKQDSHAEFMFLGGNQMAAVAGEPLIHIKDLAFMGFTQVVTKLGRIKNVFRTTRQAISEFDPDLLLLIDYAGFNLRIAKWANKRGVLVNYYIAPKVWAWNESRVKKIRQYVDHVYSIMPFEEQFFAKHSVAATFVGNPVADSITQRQSESDQQDHPQQIALVPGSRRQEITQVLPVMLAVAHNYPDYHFVITGMSMFKDLYEKLIPADSDVRIEYDDMGAVLAHAMAALVTSGTATLETALYQVPQLVCYKTNGLSYQIARRLIKVKHISLVNLILDQPAIPEFIQTQCNSSQLSTALESILPKGAERGKQLEHYRELQQLLGTTNASQKLASLIIKTLTAAS